MKSDLSTGERLKLYHEGRETDHIPFLLHGSLQAVLHNWNISEEEYRNDPDLMAVVARKKATEFGLEDVSFGLGLNTYEKCFEAEEKPTGKREALDPYTNRTLMSKLRIASEFSRKYPEFYITSSVPGCMTSVYYHLGVKEFFSGILHRHDEILKYMEYFLQCNVNWIKAVKNELGEIPISFSDPVSSLHFIGYEAFRTLSLPYVSKLSHEIERIMGYRPWAHICGMTSPVWKELSRSGLSGIGIDNCESLSAARNLIGDNLLVIGNIPPVEIMLRGTSQEVENHVIQSLKDCADSPCGYYVSSGCQIPVGTPEENIRAYADSVRYYGAGASMGKYPKRIRDLM